MNCPQDKQAFRAEFGYKPPQQALHWVLPEIKMQDEQPPKILEQNWQLVPSLLGYKPISQAVHWATPELTTHFVQFWINYGQLLQLAPLIAGYWLNRVVGS